MIVAWMVAAGPGNTGFSPASIPISLPSTLQRPNMPAKSKKPANVVDVDKILDLLVWPDHSQNTRNQYMTVSRSFLHWCNDSGIHPDSVGAVHLQRFYESRGLSRSSRFAYNQAIRALYEILQDHELCGDNPSSSWIAQYGKKNGKAGPRAPKRLPPVLDSSEESRLLESIPLSGKMPFSVYRKRVFVHLLLFSGLRVSEALSLTVGQVRLDADPAVLRVIGKGDKEREVPISPTLFEVLGGYLDRRAAFVRSGDFLFSTAKGARLTRTWAYTTVSAFFCGSDIHKSAYGPHVLRHTFATRQLRAGVAPAIVKAWLGHSDLSVTFRVYEHVLASPAGVVPV